MEFVLIDLQKVIDSGRMDYDFFSPNQKGIFDSINVDFTKNKLDNVCLMVNTGKTAPRNSYPENGVRIIKVKNVGGNGIKWDEKFYISEEFYEKAKKKSRVQIGDILMLCAAHNKSYIGRCDIIDSFPEEVLKDDSKCCCVGELIIIRSNPEKVNPEYLFSFLKLPLVQEQIIRMVKGQSAHLYPKDLKKLDIILPSKPVQEEIAKLNRNAQIEFKNKIKDATDTLSKVKKEISELIINGKKK